MLIRFVFLKGMGSNGRLNGTSPKLGIIHVPQISFGATFSTTISKYHYEPLAALQTIMFRLVVHSRLCKSCLQEA